MNQTPPEKREKAKQMLTSGMSIRAVAAALGVHRDTICALAPKKTPKPAVGWFTAKKDKDGLNKFQRYNAKKKAKSGWYQRTCADCGAPKFGSRPDPNGFPRTGKCYQCFRRTAALKRLGRELGADHPDYMEKVVEIFATEFKHPSHR